jgi:hypothetical protein
VVPAVGELGAGKLLDAVNYLYSCLEKEVVAGPSSSYVPPSEIPYLKRVDDSMQLYGGVESGEETKGLSRDSLVGALE